MILVIAEKPSVAKTIATMLKATNTNDGYIQGNGYCITWAYGHLVEFAQASSYVENPWNLSNLPIIPSPFELQVRHDDGAKK
jgi:DNA topoisomerase-3